MSDTPVWDEDALEYGYVVDRPPDGSWWHLHLARSNWTGTGRKGTRGTRDERGRAGRKGTEGTRGTKGDGHVWFLDAGRKGTGTKGDRGEKNKGYGGHRTLSLWQPTPTALARPE
jgi:hypothetical protein